MLLQQIDKPRLFKIALIFSTIVLIAWVALSVQLFILNSDLEQSQAKVDEIQTQITSIEKARDTTNDEFKKLQEQLKNKQAELSNAQKAQIYLQDLPMKMPLHAVNDFLEQLVQIDSELVWLSKIVIDNKGLRIEGLAQTCTHIGPYSQKLGTISLNGKSLNITNLNIDYNSTPCQFTVLEN